MRLTGRRTSASGGRVLAGLVVSAAILGLHLAGSAPAGAAPGDPRHRPVALVLVPDLTWATAPSALDGFATANLSMRTGRASGAEATDVYVTLGKGRRSEGLAGGAGAGRVEPTPDGGLRLLDWAELGDHDQGLHYGGALGSVGDALGAGDRRWGLASDDPQAAAAAANAGGVVPRAYPGTPEGIAAAVEAQLDALFVAVPRADLAQVLPLLDGFCTLVVSASTPEGTRHLGVLAASEACGLGTAGLASPSTHHAGLATLPDVSRTFLDRVGIPPPAAIAGGVVTPAAAIGRAGLVDRDRRARTADRSRTPFVWLFVAVHALGAAAAIRWRKARAAVACALLGIPAASFLMMLTPWWRGGALVGLLVGGTVAALIAFGGLWLVRAGDVALGIGALAALTAAVIAVDALFGSPLQVDAPFGNSTVGAGRFFGVGNIGSGFLVAGLLVAGGLALDRWGRRAILGVGAAVVAGAVAGAAPPFGADVGGALFAVPAYGLLLLGARRTRVTARHVVLLAGAAVVAVGLFAVVDLARGTASQTHLARSAGDGLGDEVVRKAGRAVQTVKAPMAAVVVIAAAALLLTRFLPGPSAALRFAAWAVLLAAVLGSALNDSGLNVAAAVLAVAWPAAVAAPA